MLVESFLCEQLRVAVNDSDRGTEGEQRLRRVLVFCFPSDRSPGNVTNLSHCSPEGSQGAKILVSCRATSLLGAPGRACFLVFSSISRPPTLLVLWPRLSSESRTTSLHLRLCHIHALPPSFTYTDPVIARGPPPGSSRTRSIQLWAVN